jgi:hypothetical protein
LLVAIGLNAKGQFTLVSTYKVNNIHRISYEDWIQLFLKFKIAGINEPPKLVGSVDSLCLKGFKKVYPKMTSNIPKSEAISKALTFIPKFKRAIANLILNQMSQATTTATAMAHLSKFVEIFCHDYPKAVSALFSPSDNSSV